MKTEDQIVRMSAALNITQDQEILIRDFEEVTSELFGGSGYVMNKGEEYLRTTQTNVRFLQSEKWDVFAAKRLLADHLKWRSQMNINEEYLNFKLTTEEQAAIEKYCVFGYYGHDLNGRPVGTQSFTTVNATKFYSIMPLERVLLYQYVIMEELLRNTFRLCSERAGHFIGDVHMVANFMNVGFWQLYSMREFAMKLASSLVKQYPKCLGHMTIINAPRVFTRIWSFVTPFLSDDTMSKIVISGVGDLSQIERFIPPQYIYVDQEGLVKDIIKPGQPKIENIWPSSDSQGNRRINSVQEGSNGYELQRNSLQTEETDLGVKGSELEEESDSATIRGKFRSSLDESINQDENISNA